MSLLSPTYITYSPDPKTSVLPPHLDYLDGLRGLAALYVVFNHLFQEIANRSDAGLLPLSLEPIFTFFAWGRPAVALFIVLSGYCLMMPVVKSGELKGGLCGFVARRSRRILPPYYFALLVSWALILTVPGLRQGIGTLWDTHLPAFTPGVVVSHLLLVHNLLLAWAYKINGPLWSVAAEWQIYFLFALLLLPMWRRCGTFPAIIFCTALGLAPHLPLHHRLDFVCTHFLGLFAMGMAGAVINFTDSGPEMFWRNRVPWGMIVVACVLIFLGATIVLPNAFLLDFMVGIGLTAFMVHSTRQIQENSGAATVAVRLLSSKPATWLGGFSYSLYLLHYILLISVHAVLIRHGIPILPSLAILIACVPLVVLVTYLFYLVCEKPFQRCTLRREMPPQASGGGF